MNRAKLALFDYLTEGFSTLYPSVVRHMPGYDTQQRGMAGTLPT